MAGKIYAHAQDSVDTSRRVSSKSRACMLFARLSLAEIRNNFQSTILAIREKPWEKGWGHLLFCALKHTI